MRWPFDLIAILLSGIVALLHANLRLRNSGRSAPEIASIWITSVVVGGVMLSGALYLPDRFIPWFQGIAAAVAVPLIGVALFSANRGASDTRREMRDYKRWSQHQCTNCGYDLQGISSHKCPECGTEIPRGYWMIMNYQKQLEEQQNADKQRAPAAALGQDDNKNPPI